MYPADFDYVRPSSVDEAVALLVRHGDDAKVLAGGHSLIPAMKLRLARPKVIVDIGRIRDMSYIREANGQIVVGAMTTHAEIETAALLRTRCPLLPETAASIGDVQVRNRGTIGGSLAHADPAADWPAAILALDAELEVAGPRGRRTVRAGQFFVGLLETALAADEILCEIRVPPTPSSVAYVKTEQKASGFALAGVAAVLMDRDPRPVMDVRVGITGVAATPYRAQAVERALAGQREMTPDRIAAAAMHAAEAAQALGDIHASPEYRAHIARVNTRRALLQALQRAGNR
jgi:aerobic carbon-monoxide dehydrogenase medium subunit